MTSHGFAELLGELGIQRSYSRPRVSDDNAFSEAHFHTLKYQPNYPGRFRDIAHARSWCDEFFGWYNVRHHHDGVSLFTPEQVFPVTSSESLCAGSTRWTRPTASTPNASLPARLWPHDRRNA
jgi:Integrase core domain